MRLLDFDYVTLSSLNRHASATRAEVGTPKVQSLKNSIASISPWIEVEALVELWSAENEREHRWLEGSDWVIDAIDNIGTKVSLSSYHYPYLNARSRSTYYRIVTQKASRSWRLWVQEQRWTRHTSNPPTYLKQ